jgi:hypothetical protein
MSREVIGEYLSVGCDLCQMLGSGSFCQRSFTELVLRLFAEFTLSTFASLSVDSANVLRVTVEGFRMTSLASVTLSGAKGLNGPDSSRSSE